MKLEFESLDETSSNLDISFSVIDLIPSECLENASPTEMLLASADKSVTHKCEINTQTPTFVKRKKNNIKDLPRAVSKV